MLVASGEKATEQPGSRVCVLSAKW